MPRSFEDALIARIDREGNPVDRQHYTRNEKFNQEVAITWNKIRPRYQDFLPRPEQTGGVTYPLDQQKRDHQVVKSIQSSPEFQFERSEAAAGLEYAVMEAIHEHGWLGQDAHVTPTSEYDDHINGLDMVVSVPRGETGELLRFGVDTTVGQYSQGIDKKLNRTLEQLKSDRLNPVKYFISDETGERQRLNVPRFVLAISPAASSELQSTMVDESATIDTHVVQQEVLEELEEQAVFAVDFLLNKHQLPGYQRTADAEELLKFVASHQAELAPHYTLGEYAAVLAHVHGVRKEKALSVPGEYERASSEMIIDSLHRLAA